MKRTREPSIRTKILLSTDWDPPGPISPEEMKKLGLRWLLHQDAERRIWLRYQQRKRAA